MEINVDGWKYKTDPTYDANAGRILVSHRLHEGFEWHSPEPKLGEYFGSCIAFDPVNGIFAVGCKGANQLGTGDSRIIFYTKNREVIAIHNKPWRPEIRNFGCKFMFSKDGKYFIHVTNMKSRNVIFLQVYFVDWENKDFVLFFESMEIIQGKPNIRDLILDFRVTSPTEIMIQIQDKVITHTQHFHPH